MIFELADSLEAAVSRYIARARDVSVQTKESEIARTAGGNSFKDLPFEWRYGAAKGC